MLSMSRKLSITYSLITCRGHVNKAEELRKDVQTTFLRVRELSYVQDRGHVNQVLIGKKTSRVKYGMLFVGRLKAIKNAMGFSHQFISYPDP